MKLNKIICIILLTLNFFSCEVFESLDELPPNELVKENLFVDQESAEGVLNGVYETLLSDGYFKAIVVLPSLKSIDMIDRHKGGIGSSIIGSSDHDLKIGFSSLYGLINRSNVLIEGVQKMDKNLFLENRQNEIIAEAHFLRAMGHFDVLRLFGHHFDVASKYGIILRNEPTELKNREKSRATVMASYKSILTDLDFALTELSKVKNNSKYVNYYTACALKSRVLFYLAAGSNNDADLYENAIQYADMALAGGYPLETNYASIFGGFSTESIFETPNPKRHISLNRVIRFFDDSYGVRYAASKKFSNDVINDPRTNQNITSGYVNKIIKHKKRDVLFLLRATELVLLKAESYLYLKDNEKARLNYNMVRQSRGVQEANTTIVDQALLDLIREEFRLDLCFESGHEWFQLVRQGLDAVKVVIPDIKSSNHFSLPIPTVEILNNTKCEQNPGYQTQITN